MIYDSRRRGSPSPEAAVDVFLHLANASSDERQYLQEGKFLMLAAYAAQHAGYSEIADRCRTKVLEQNPNHMLKSFPTMAQAVAAEHIIEYAEQLRKIYPLEKAEYLLAKFQAAGYRGQHEFGEQLNAAPRLAIHGQGHRVHGKRKPPGGRKRNSSRPSTIDVKPLPLNWPQPSWGVGFSRRTMIAFGVGVVTGLVAGLCLALAFHDRIRHLLG